MINSHSEFSDYLSDFEHPSKFCLEVFAPLFYAAYVYFGSGEIVLSGRIVFINFSRVAIAHISGTH